VKQRETELVLRAARLYYEGHYSQDQVASKLNTSRSNVSRMLSDAKRLGFVEIKIVSPTHKHEALSSQLSELLKIKDVQVIASESNDLTLNTVGRAAASALLKNLRDYHTIAISWGRGLEATVVNTHSETLSGLKVTQLMGSMSSVNTSVSAEEVGRNLAKNLNAQFVPFLSPVVVSNSKVRDSLLEEESIARTLQLARSADVALVGIGSAGSSSSEMVFSEYKATKTERDSLVSEYAGDIAARLYKKDGTPLSAKLDARVIGLTLDEIRKIPRVIGVASGAEKVLGVVGAARAGLIDTLIVDLACANSVIKSLQPTAVKSA
jgi:DNA-binding transcriptional regulator LsrR (DeoR family)